MFPHIHCRICLCKAEVELCVTSQICTIPLSPLTSHPFQTPILLPWLHPFLLAIFSLLSHSLFKMFSLSYFFFFWMQCMFRYSSRSLCCHPEFWNFHYCSVSVWWSSFQWDFNQHHAVVTIRIILRPCRKSKRHCKAGGMGGLCKSICRSDTRENPASQNAQRKWTIQNSMLCFVKSNLQSGVAIEGCYFKVILRKQSQGIWCANVSCAPKATAPPKRPLPRNTLQAVC